MQKPTPDDVTVLLQSLAKLEADLRVLRREVTQLAAARSSKRSRARSAKAQFESLRGIFPASNTTLEDFRDARGSWTRNLDRKP